MRITKARLLVKKSRESRKSQEVELMVDSGAVYSLVPEETLKALGIKSYKTLIFSLADGTSIKRKGGDAYFELKGDGGAAPVIFGEEADEALLGATTLESIGLVLNPFTRELHPMRMVLARFT